jgi:RNA polymerase sigma factor (sigma-70 family)
MQGSKRTDALTESARAIVADPVNLRAAQRLAGKWCKTYKLVGKRRGRPYKASVTYDELLSAVHLGMCQAARDYDASRGTFLNYAGHRMIGAMIVDIREILGNRASGATVCDVPEDVPPVESALDNRDLVEWAIRQLPEREATIIRDLYALRATSQADVARKFGISYVYVSYLRARALAQMRRRLQGSA